MKVELIGAIDFKKLASFLDKRVGEIIDDSNSLKDYINVLDSKNVRNTDEYIEFLDHIINYLKGNSNGNISLMTKIINAVTSKKRNSIIEYVESLKELVRTNGEVSSEDTDNLKKIIDEQINDLNTIRPDVVDTTERLETERRAEVVTAAGKLSRFDGNVFDILELVSEDTLEDNCKYANFVSGTLKHESITDHDYCLFALQDISILIEQFIIAERFASFTIKSRRLTDSSNIGYYVPDFHDKDGNIIKENDKAKQDYIRDMDHQFAMYAFFLKNGIDYEDARYCLPYCYHANNLMGMDSHVLKDLIIKCLKTKYAKIQEIREFGERLYEIAKKKVPYIIKEIDAVKPDYEDYVGDFVRSINTNTSSVKYTILDKPKLISKSDNIDESILVSAVMRYTQLSFEEAKTLLEEAVSNDPSFKETLMRLIFFKGDQNELAQVSFEFQFGISYAVLTHYTRHRTHPIIVPDFAPLGDLYQFMTPPAIKENEELNDKYVDMFTLNEIRCNDMKSNYGIRDEDLVYYTLSGNMVNVVTRFDGKTFAHIEALRKCNRAQWESRIIAEGFHDEIKKLEDAQLYSRFIGPTCETQDFCREGKQCCGKIYELRKQNQ